MAVPPKIIAFGDSTTAYADDVCVYTELIKQKLAENNISAEVINSGIKLNTSEDAVNRLEKDIISHKPDITIIQFGINDSAVDVWKNPPATQPRVGIEQYERNIRHIVQKLRHNDSQIVLMSSNPLHWTGLLKMMYGKFPYNVDDVDGMNVLLKDYVQRLIHIAKELELPYIDIYSAHKSDNDWCGGKYLRDGIHPNDAGHRLVIENLWPVLNSMLKSKIQN